VFCVRVLTCVCMCLCECACPCVFVCACVCAGDSVRACACVTVCGVCVFVCVVISWRSGLRSMCVCVCGNVKPCCLESTPGCKRERTPTRGHTRFSPPPPRATRLQRPRPVVACCDVTQTRMDVQGRFLDASGLTRQPKYTPFRIAALRSLAARARRQTISAFESLILLRAPLTNFEWTLRTKCNLKKFGRGINSPHQNWKIGKGIPSSRFGAGIGNAWVVWS